MSWGANDCLWPMRDTGGASKECVGNEAHCPRDSACRVSLAVDLRGHVPEGNLLARRPLNSGDTASGED